MTGLRKYTIAVMMFLFLVLPQLVFAQDTTNTKPGNTIPEGLTALDVINKYVDVTGGRENYLKVIDRTTIMTGEMMNRKFTVTVQQKAPDKLRQEIQVGPATQIFIFDGTNAVMLMGEIITPVKGNELEKTRIEAQTNFLLDPESFGVTPQLLGMEMIDSVECFKISMTNDTSATWIQYYDVNSGLKIKELRNIEAQQSKFIQESYYDDYSDVDGLKYPFRIKQSMGLQTAEMKVISISINTGLDDKLFEIPEE